MQRRFIFFLFVANIVDAIATDTGLRYEVIEELNMNIAFIYEKSVLLYYLAKVGGVTLGLYLLLKLEDKLKESRLITTLLGLASISYLIIIILHVAWITLWLSSN